MLIDNLDLREKLDTEVDLSVPSLRALSYALKHPETWPEGFHFHYSSSYACAVGLAISMWWTGDTCSRDSIMEKFGISLIVASNLFYKVHAHHSRDKIPRNGEVTSKEVAYVIDKYLDGELILIN